MAIVLIDFGFKLLEVGFAILYIAQLAVYFTVLYTLKKWCYAQQNNSKWRKFALVVSEIKVFTINGIQGGQVKLLVYNITVANPLKFV